MKNSLLSILALASLLGPVAPMSANRLEQSEDAAKAGDLGLEAVYTGNRQKNYVVHKFVPSQDRVVVEFFIQIEEDFDFQKGGGHYILQLKKTGTKKTVVSVKMLKADDGSRLQFRVRNGKKNKKIKKKVTLLFGKWTRITIDLTTASLPNQSNGSLRVLKNNVEKILETGLDNDNQQVGSIRLGQVGKPPRNWFGALYFDEFTIRKSP